MLNSKLICIFLVVILLAGCSVPQDTNQLQDPSVQSLRTVQAKVSASPSPVSLPEVTPTPTPVPSDFLTIAGNRETLLSLIESYNLAQALAYVNDYIETNSPPSSDSAYHLQASLDTAIPLMRSCRVRHDSFDNTYEVYYPHYDKITKDVSVVAKLLNDRLSIIVGFVSSDWVFFTNYEVRDSKANLLTTGEVDYFDVTRDVLRGRVCEYAEVDLDGLFYIISADSPTIRFYDSDHAKHYDHTFSKKECTALDTIASLHFLLSSVRDFLVS